MPGAPATPVGDTAPQHANGAPAFPPTATTPAHLPPAAGWGPAMPLPAFAAAPARLKPKGMPTAVFALILFAALIAIAGTTLFVRTNAVASQIPGPTAASVVDDFVAGATSGDDAWRKLTLPTMLATYDTTESVPLIGTPKLLESLGVTTEVKVVGIEFESNGRPVQDERVADRARAELQVTYGFTIDGTEDTLQAPVELWLSRPFTYDGANGPQPYDRSKTPTGMAPWRVLDLKATGVGTQGKSSGGTTHCYSTEDIIVQLSTSARTNGELTVDCVVGEGFLVHGDAAAIAARLPVLGKYSQSTDTMHLEDETPGSRPLATFVIQAEGDPVGVVAVQTTDGWQLLGVAELAP